MAFTKFFTDFLGKQTVKDVLSGAISYNEGVINGGMIGGVYAILVCAFVYGWYKTKPIFYPLSIDDIDWNCTVATKESKDDVEKGEKIAYWMFGLLMVSAIFVISKRILEPSSYASNNVQTQTQTQTQAVSSLVKDEQPLPVQTQLTNTDLLFTTEVSKQIPEIQNLFSDQNFLNYVNSKIVDGQTAFELIKTAGENKDISKLPRIRAIIDEYYNQLSANNVKLAFTCSLNDNRNVFVTARDGGYIYTIFDKSGKNIELTFTNTANQIQNNSLLHRNGITLIMQNKTYQYRISNQANKTTIFVYNGDKGVSTHYCQADKTYWDMSQLPVFGNNTGSPNHRKYCKQVINEGLYLAKMSKICPIEMSGLNLRVEDTALFFDAEGCSYLLFESENAQKNMIVNLSNKLNSSIDKKIQKLGSQFCAKESGYARKMAERYTDFFNGR